MNTTVIRKIIIFYACLVFAGTAWSADIYKVVDKDGNVTFTDQPPGDGSQPMDLPPLSIIETNIEVDQAGSDPEIVDETPAEPTLQDLRRMFGDFHITAPQNEETFWGTGNTVVVSWASASPPVGEMSGRLFVDGQAQVVPASGGVTLTLDRGEHTAYVELLDAGNRRIVATPTVTFFVQQFSANR